MEKYDHRKIEKKWREKWEKSKLYKTGANSSKKKCYVLDMFPYPSGEGLHVGHPKGYIATDIYSRWKSMNDYDVLHPMGWDAFGLPAENYAIKNRVHPRVAVEKNIARYKEQLSILGFNYDWEKEINTTDPAYYKWTQWIFLKLLEKGLAYESYEPINWCPFDKTGLANEDVEDGKCERCGTPVEKKPMRQWVLRITDYAEKLLEGLGTQEEISENKRPKRILIGTRNNAKFLMMKECFPNIPGVELVSLNDISAVDDSTLVEGDDFEENARMKAEFYFKKTGIPTISTDNIFWIEKWPENEGVIVHMRKLANPKNGNATDEEVISFCQNWLKTVGGESRAHFNYALAYCDSSGKNSWTSIQRKYILQTKESKSFWKGYPIESLLIDPETGEYKSDQENSIRYANLIKLLNGEVKNRIFDNESVSTLDWPKSIRESQRNWIGKSAGALFKFKVESQKFKVNDEIEVFTTRADTLFGVTYVVLAPEHPIIKNLELGIINYEEVNKYVKSVKDKPEIERTAEKKEKTGVEIKGIKAINPANGEEISIWVADYVLASYGTGAVMAVPAHDERDFEFAKKFSLPIRDVVAPLFTREGTSDAWRKDEKEKVRPTVVCLVKHWKENKYLFLKKKSESDSEEGCIVAIAGGIDAGEDITEAGSREIKEETGYCNVKYVKSLGSQVYYRYYAKNSNQNRNSILYPLYYELIDDQVTPISEHEKELHDPIWLSESDIAKKYFPGRGFNPIFWNRLKGLNNAFVGEGLLVNSGKFDGMDSDKARLEITKEFGTSKITYKLKDWVFSRQRYWGEPIPVIHCEKCGVVPVPEEDLPVLLPEVDHYEPTGTGESPLANIEKWVNVKCPKCGGKAKRETNTMPQWAGSSWYHIAYPICENSKFEIRNSKAINHWLPVDYYVGGAEHATRHLVYARFWHKFLFEIGVVNSSEPFIKLQHVGLIGGADGRKMSKRFGNVVNPDEMVDLYGADTFRLYEMFMGPFSDAIPWSTEGMIGPRRFLERVWRMQEKVNEKVVNTKQVIILLNKTIKKVGEDIENFKFNTAVSNLMVFVNAIEKEESISNESYSKFLVLLSPFAPHITEEIWMNLGNADSIHKTPWPIFDERNLEEEKKKIIIQVDGKLRGSIEISGEISDEEIQKLALENEAIQRWTLDKKIKKIIVVKNRIVSIVTE